MNDAIVNINGSNVQTLELFFFAYGDDAFAVNNYYDDIFYKNNNCAVIYKNGFRHTADTA